MNRYALLAAGALSAAAVLAGAYALGTVVAASPPSTPAGTAEVLSSVNTATPPMAHRPGLLAARLLFRDAARALNITPAALRADLRAGKTPALIAEGEGSSAGALEVTLTTDLTNRLQAAVKAGRISAAHAARMESHLSRLVDRFVTVPAPRRAMIRMALIKDAAAALNLNVATLRTDLRNGESLAALASQQGSSAAALEATLTADAKAALDNAVQAGKISETRATSIESHLTARIDALVARTWHMPQPQSQSAPAAG